MSATFETHMYSGYGAQGHYIAILGPEIRNSWEPHFIFQTRPFQLYVFLYFGCISAWRMSTTFETHVYSGYGAQWQYMAILGR